MHGQATVERRRGRRTAPDETTNERARWRQNQSHHASCGGMRPWSSSIPRRATLSRYAGSSLRARYVGSSLRAQPTAAITALPRKRARADRLRVDQPPPPACRGRRGRKTLPDHPSARASRLSPRALPTPLRIDRRPDGNAAISQKTAVSFLAHRSATPADPRSGSRHSGGRTPPLVDALPCR